METPHPAIGRIDTDLIRRKRILPAPFAPRVRIFSGQRMGQGRFPAAPGQIRPVPLIHFLQVLAQIMVKGIRQQCGAVFIALSAAHNNETGIEVKVLHPQAQ